MQPAKRVVSYTDAESLAPQGVRYPALPSALLEDEMTDITKVEVDRLSAPAFAEAKKEFRAFQASWEGSIAKAINVYTDAVMERALTRLWPDGFGPKNLDEFVVFIEEERKCDAEYLEAVRSTRAA